MTIVRLFPRTDGSSIVATSSELKRHASITAGMMPTLLLVGLAILACSSGDHLARTQPDTTSQFFFAVISDTHIATKADEPQNEVFLYTAEVVNQHTPSIDFVVCTGDLVERLPSDDPEYYRTHHDTALDEFIRLTSLLNMPLYCVLGNHDYYSAGLLPIPTKHTKIREDLFVERGIVPAPYYVFEHHGIKFYCLNSMQQDPSVPWGPNAVGTLGPEQAAWLRNELSDRKPAFMFLHHPLATDATTHAGISSLIPFEIPRADGHFSKYQWSLYRDYTDPVYEIVKSHRDQIKAIFFGHSHLFLKDTYEGIPLFMTDSMRPPSSSAYEGKPMRYYIVACEIGTGRWAIYNEHMIPYFNQHG